MPERGHGPNHFAAIRTRARVPDDYHRRYRVLMFATLENRRFALFVFRLIDLPFGKAFIQDLQRRIGRLPPYSMWIMPLTATHFGCFS